MTTRSLVFRSASVIGFVCMTTIGLARVSAAPVTVTDAYQKAALADFQMNVNDYLELRWRAGLRVQPPGTSWSSRAWAVEAHAAAVQRAREGVRRGNVFTAAVSILFRQRIDEAFRQQGLSAAAMGRTLSDRPNKGRGPVVNERFSWLRIAPVPAWLSAALPTLPPVLSYRLFDRDLVLFDQTLAIVVDILPGVLVDDVQPR